MKLITYTSAAFVALSSLTALSVPARAQDQNIRAALTLRDDRGRCTIEVVVDDAVEIDVRGDSAHARTLAGQPAQFRRFECTAPLPQNPANFRFSGVDGRGSQQLLRDPSSSGGTAIIRIEDRQGGADKYKFDLIWDNRGGNYDNRTDPRFDPRNDTRIDNRNDNRNDPRFGDNRRPVTRFAAEDAVRVCRESVRQQAVDRFRTSDVTFRRINIDDQPGRNDWVVGSLLVRARDGREEVLPFSCSVDFQNGTVRSATIEGADRRSQGGPQAQRCNRALEERLRTDGFDRIELRDNPGDGRRDRIFGFARAAGRNGSVNFEFSCVVDPRDGDLRLDVRRRDDYRWDR